MAESGDGHSAASFDPLLLEQFPAPLPHHAGAVLRVLELLNEAGDVLLVPVGPQRIHDGREQRQVLDPLRGSFDAESILDRVENAGVNSIQIVGDAMGVPLLEALTANPGRWDLSKVVYLGNGGAVLSQHVKQGIKEQIPNLFIGDGMGTSETGISGMGAPVKDGGFMRLAVDENQAVIKDGRIARVGEVGYLARCGHTPIGYYNDPGKTAEIFVTIDDRMWVLTGDQARLDDDEMMTLLGRGSTCINSGGEKIYPEEVEEVLRAHPAIHDATVVGTANKKWGQQVSAIVSLSSHSKGRPPSRNTAMNLSSSGSPGRPKLSKPVLTNSVSPVASSSSCHRASE